MTPTPSQTAKHAKLQNEPIKLLILKQWPPKNEPDGPKRTQAALRNLLIPRPGENHEHGQTAQNPTRTPAPGTLFPPLLN